MRAFQPAEGNQPAPVLLPLGRRDDYVGEHPPHDVLPSIAEGALSRLIELRDAAFVIDRHDAVERRV